MRDIRQTKDGQFTFIGAMYYLHRDYFRHFKYYTKDLVDTIKDYL